MCLAVKLIGLARIFLLLIKRFTMSVAEEIQLTGLWKHEQGSLEFLENSTFQKHEKGTRSKGYYRIELDESIGSLVLDLDQEDGKQERYTFNVALNNEGTFLTLFWPPHVMAADYKKAEDTN